MPAGIHLDCWTFDRRMFLDYPVVWAKLLAGLILMSCGLQITNNRLLLSVLYKQKKSMKGKKLSV